MMQVLAAVLFFVGFCLMGCDTLQPQEAITAWFIAIKLTGLALFCSSLIILCQGKVRKYK